MASPRFEFKVGKSNSFNRLLMRFERETPFWLPAGESTLTSRLDQSSLGTIEGFKNLASSGTHPNNWGPNEKNSSGCRSSNRSVQKSRQISDGSLLEMTRAGTSASGISRSIIYQNGVRKSESLSSPRGLKTPTSKIGKSPKPPSSSYILAVTEGRGQARGEVGIAGMDPKRPLLVLSQISDGQRYVNSLTKMNVFDFSEVIVPNTFVEGPAQSKLYQDIRRRFPEVTLTGVQRRHFSETVGIDLISQYRSPESASAMVLLRDKFYALSAASALIKYVEFTQNVHLPPHSLRVEYQGTEDTMLIDLDTANRLELVVCMNHPEINFAHSLFGAVNHCHTKGGVRLLRASILQPSCSLAKIQKRLDCVGELVENQILFHGLEAAVASFSNVETLLDLCMHLPLKQEGLRVAEHQLKYTLLLKTTLELLPKLTSSLENAKTDYFRDVLKNLKEDPRFRLILDRILETVFENAKTVRGSMTSHLHGCFVIKAGVNSLLDVAKKTYCEIVQEIMDHVKRLRETHDLPLRISFSAGKGFHIQCTLPPGRGKNLPEEFILVKKSRKTLTFYTAELVALDQRSQHVLDEIKLMTNAVLFELLADIRRHVGCLFNLCEIVAEIDLTVSFAHVGSAKNYVKPVFGDELDLKESRHPILDVTRDGEVVPNDVVIEETLRTSGRSETVR